MLQVEGKDLVIGKEFEEFGYEIYPLNKPLQPNDTVTMTMFSNIKRDQNGNTSISMRSFGGV